MSDMYEVTAMVTVKFAAPSEEAAIESLRESIATGDYIDAFEIECAPYSYDPDELARAMAAQAAAEERIEELEAEVEELQGGPTLSHRIGVMQVRAEKAEARAEKAEARIAELEGIISAAETQPPGRIVRTTDGRPAWVRQTPPDVTEAWGMIREIIVTMSNRQARARRWLDEIESALTWQRALEDTEHLDEKLGQQPRPTHVTTNRPPEGHVAVMLPRDVAEAFASATEPGDTYDMLDSRDFNEATKACHRALEADDE